MLILPGSRDMLDKAGFFRLCPRRVLKIVTRHCKCFTVVPRGITIRKGHPSTADVRVDAKEPGDDIADTETPDH